MSVSVAAPAARNRPDGAARPRPATAGRALSVAIYLHDLSGGGVERQSLIMAQEFRRRGVDVTLVLHRLRGPLRDQVPAGLRIVDLKSARTLLDVPALMRFLRAEKPDVLLSNVDFNNIAALLAKALSFSDSKVVICQHNPISKAYFSGEGWMYRLVGMSYRILSPLISSAVAVSDGVAAELARIAGIPAKRVVTINNPVVGPDFAAWAADRMEHPWFNVPGRPVFVTAGRLVRQKDHATMIQALALHRRRFDSRLIILGAGHLLDRLAQLVDRLGLGQAVALLGFQSNALPYFRQADAFVLSSCSEGFGNVIVEALGCGTPVISTDCQHGPAEILDGGRYGLLVPTCDPEALAAAMDQVGTLRERFPAEVLRERAAQYGYAACASRFMGLFKALAPDRAWTAP